MNNDNSNDSTPAEGNQGETLQVEAFQDDFTKQFLQSTAPTREGYYPFLSGNGRFKMDFPEDMVIQEKSYTRVPKKRAESLWMYNPNENRDLYFTFSVYFYGFSHTEETSKEQLSEQLSTELEFYEVPLEIDSQSLYVSEFERESGMQGIAGLIWGKDGDQIHIISDIECSTDIVSKTCSSMKRNEKNRIIEWMKSIQLIESEDGSDEYHV